jgi:hypothetical protein
MFKSAFHDHAFRLPPSLVAVQFWIAGKSPIRKPELAFSEFLYNSFSVSVLAVPKIFLFWIYQHSSAHRFTT